MSYEKGYLFLRRIEENVGRKAFDRFLRAYIETFRFQSIISEDFVALLREQLPGIENSLDLPRWLEAPGLPPDAPEPSSPRLLELQTLAQTVASGALPKNSLRGLGALDWQVLLESLRPLYLGLCSAGDGGRELARAVFKRARPRYHPLAVRVLEGLVS